MGSSALDLDLPSLAEGICVDLLGAASSRSLISITSPDTGSTESLSALTDSTEPFLAVLEHGPDLVHIHVGDVAELLLAKW
jgi:hypothetical protein